MAQTAVESGGAPVSANATEELQSRMRGVVLRPSDQGYDEARKVWNGTVDRRPSLIAQCAGAADVIQAVRFAREKDMLLSVRGGGHGLAGMRCALTAS